MINILKYSVVEKRDVDVDDAEDEIDEEFDPIINKGFCKWKSNICPLFVLWI